MSKKEILISDYKSLWVGNDITAAIKAVLQEYPSGLISIAIPSGNFVMSDGVIISKSGVYISGAGMMATSITFKPTKDTKMFEWNAGADKLSWGGISNLLLRSDETNTFKKTGIEFWDTSRFIMENIQIREFGGNDANIGLYTHGREIFTARNINISAPNPVVIGKNPNIRVAPLLDADHFHFSDMFLDSSYGPVMLVEDGVVLTHFTIDGAQPWTRGSKGFYWSSPNQTYSSYHVNLANIRFEQATDPNEFSIYIDAKVQGLVIKNTRLAIGRKGIYLRKVTRISLRDVAHPATDKLVLDVDGSCDGLELDNVFWNGGTVSLGTLYEKISFNKIDTASPTPDYAYYSRSLTGATQEQKPIKVLGANIWQWSGSLADLDYVRTPIIGAARKTAIITFSVRNGTQSILEGASAIDSPEKTTLLNSTSNVSLANEAGKIVLLKDGGNNIKLFNRMGCPLDVVITITYY